MRCPRCGNENQDQQRFCGMCGASLLSTPAPAPAPAQPASIAAPKPPVVHAASAPAPAPEPRRAATAVSETPASISGPSFLGLNEPAGPARSTRKRASLSIDPHSAPGSNLDYLLEEDEPQHHWGIGRILLILIALGMAVGFGYLRFRNQGLAWLTGLKRPAAVAQDSAATESTGTIPPASTPSITPESQPAATPAASASPTPVPGSAPNAGAVPANAPAAVGGAAPAADNATVDKPQSSETEPAPASDKATLPTDSDSTKNETSPEASAPPSKPAANPAPAPKAPAPKPSAASKPPVDSVAEAQKYLYGRGAPHDCDRGMRLLKPEANRGNAKAMIEMGALYSAGLCTPRDLPTAYRWFALALRKDPDNTSIHDDLNKLWSEMTQPERQLAIKMTQ